MEPDQLRKRQWDDESDDVTNTSENHDVSKKRIKEESSSIKTEPTDDSAKEVLNMKKKKIGKDRGNLQNFLLHPSEIL